ncbi:MAG TPA: winged helix-turn-helix transcriptional regulator [Candidatus Nanoarchaeia archaeon]|nr:winged helix-turn-helix transcriptional regulator [Candidatus Nanoarchaeia archaeon]
MNEQVNIKLYELTQDCRISHLQLGKKVSLSKNGVDYKIQRMEHEGLIQGYFAQIDLPNYCTRELFLKLSMTEEETSTFIQHLCALPFVIIVDELSGDWDLILEMTHPLNDFFPALLNQILEPFSKNIVQYQVHEVAKFYFQNMLPIRKDFFPENLPKPSSFSTLVPDKTDHKLLALLDENATLQFREMADRIGLTYETVSARIKHLKEAGIIRRFLAKINVGVLGLNMYFVWLNFHLFNEEQRLVQYLRSKKEIRACFKSANSPTLFIYYVAASISDLDSFLRELRSQFKDTLSSMSYFYSKRQHKYNLYPRA